MRFIIKKIFFSYNSLNLFPNLCDTMPENPTRDDVVLKNSAPDDRPGKSWFFGIGINEYQHFSNLNNAVKDVKDIIILLQDKYELDPDHVVTLYNEEANRRNIIRKFDWLQREVGAKDKLLIYYSGHGHLVDMGKNKKGFWIPTDAEKDNTSQYIRNSTVREYLEDINSLHTLLISDSCFSGSLFVRGGSRAETALKELEQRKSRWAICSGRHDEQVYDGTPGTNSPFANSILDILRRNQEEKLNVAKLSDRIVELTRANYKQLPEGNPLFGVGHNGGQYVFCFKQSEDISWKSCKATNSIKGYFGYIKQYPRGKYAKEALQRIKSLEEDFAWKKALDRDKLSDYSHYLIQYPNGKYINEAYKRVKALEEGIVISKPLIKEPLKQKYDGVNITEKKGSRIDAFTDPRDGQVYKTVEINGKIWMTENLNYDSGEGFWFYGNHLPNGEKYGRLYTLEAAQNACPEGWHIPTEEEWISLAEYSGGYAKNKNKDEIIKGKQAYSFLIEGGNSNFNAVLGGGFRYGEFDSLGTNGYYWSSTKVKLPSVFELIMKSNHIFVFKGVGAYLSKDIAIIRSGISVRCVKD